MKRIIILTLLVVLFFSISSVSSQSVTNDGLSEKNKVLKSNSLSQKATGSSTAKVTTNTKTTNKTSTTTNKKTSKEATKTKTTSKKTSTTTTKKTNKTTSTTTTINKKTLAKTSTSFMNYVDKNGKFPKVKIRNKNYSNTEYLYLISKAIENNSNSKIEIKNNLVKPYNNTNSKSVKGNLNKTEYVQIASKTRKFIEKNQRAPNWVSSSKGNIPYNQLILSFSKCLDNYNKTSKLPNSIKLDNLDLGVIKSKINKTGKSTATAKNTTTKTTTNTANSSAKTTTKTTTNTANSSAKTTTNSNETTNKIETNTPKNPMENNNGSLVERSMTYVNFLLNNILDRLDPSKYKINLTKSDEGNVKLNTSKVNLDISGKSSVNVQISAKNSTSKKTGTNKNNTTKTTAKTTTTKKTNKTSTATKKTSTTTTKKTTTKKNNTASTKKASTKSNAKTSTAKASSKKSTENSVKTISNALKKYLTSSKNCQANNKQIKELVNKLTSTLKTDYAKGKKLFEWVRDNIVYDKYRNTKRGALKTLQNKKGNCVDQSHLLVALSRAAGIPARYKNGNNCKFTSGYVSGHVWTELYINKKWVVADTTSSRNSLGTIKNWNTKNFSLVGTYSSLNF